MTVDYANTCGVKRVGYFTGATEPHRMPQCNRPRGHKGEHREYDKESFAVRAEWGSGDVYAPRCRKAGRP